MSPRGNTQSKCRPSCWLESRGAGYCARPLCRRRLVREAALRAQGNDAGRLLQIAENLERLAGEKRPFYENPCDEDLERLMARYPT